mgnify:CR=1 FL=1
MNILTFDIEDWYNCDFISGNLEWSSYEVRIYEGVDRGLSPIKKKNIKGTFFCLGWLAENHPSIIERIHKEGHQVGCHSFQHQLATEFNASEFYEDTLKAKLALESIIGEKVTAFRAPGFSITKCNKDYLGILANLGFKYDASIFPAYHDYGGMPSYGVSKPKLIDVGNDKYIKEFPINTVNVLGRNLVFSGGGFFRLFPYSIIKYWANKSGYMMTYFHPRDFDYNQPRLKNLLIERYFKSYIGIKGAFSKFEKLLANYDFINIEQAEKEIDWTKTEILDLRNL